MSVSPGYQAFVLDQLRRAVPAVRERRMFGAIGLYSGELFFALIDDDILYLKVDDETRPEFEARGMPPFQPYGDGTTSMNYQQLPEEVLEDLDSLRQWSARAIDVARRAKTKPKRKAKATSAKSTKKKRRG
jgi:DNA transformation protein